MQEVEYVEGAIKTFNTQGNVNDLNHLILGVVSEVGEVIDLFKKHINLYADTWELSKTEDADQIKHIRPLNKFCKLYIQDFKGAKELRDQLMHAKNVQQLLELLNI